MASRVSRSFVKQPTALSYLAAVFGGEHVDRDLGRRAGRRAVNLTKVCFRVDLDRDGDLVQHVSGLVDPTALVPGARKDFLDRLPDAERCSAGHASATTDPKLTFHLGSMGADQSRF